MDELLEQFLIEGRDLVAQAAADFDLLARTPGNAAAIDSAFRAIHTLKGSVGIFPMGPAERVLHAAEDVLERARKGEAVLDAATVGGLVACLDAVDRWIDEIEQAGAVGPDAERTAATAMTRLAGDAANTPPPDWATHLAVQGPEALVAFRYAPDADCFFRGEDPLAIVAEVPELRILDIQPAGGDWPALDAIEPFTCFSVFEGVSAAPFEAVQAAFRLVQDQVALHRIGAVAEADAHEIRATTTLRVDAARVDALADGLGELIVAVNGFAPLAEQADKVDRAFAANLRAVQANVERVVADLHRSVGAVRLVPLAPMLRRLPRLAREIAEGLGKSVAFSMTGDSLEVDKQIADGLFEPLLHLLRNAIDHGIEDEALRTARGKPAEGQVTFTAARDGDSVSIELADDGAGIDADHIRRVAVERGLLSAERAGQLSDAAALRLIFAPGFSTAAAVTEVSGRGVGMDAVQAAVEKLRGTVDIESVPGEGSRFRLRLPANALTTRLLIVEVAGDRYGVALEQIVETVRVAGSDLFPIGDGLACVLRGKTVPVLDLATLLGNAETAAEGATLLVTRAGGQRVALKVDGFARRIDALVRPPRGILAGMRGVTGSTLLGDGGVLLVLDLPELAA